LPQQRTRISVPAGTVFREQNIILSPFEDDGTSHFRASKMFVGAASVGRHGLMQTDTLLLQAEQRLMERADEIILLVDSSKFNGPAGHVVCGLDDVDTVVTDKHISAEHKRLLKDAGVRLVVVDAGADAEPRQTK
jgi:DeoR family ulaG and ulaABCDEF operon transcriptional repressor